MVGTEQKVYYLHPPNKHVNLQLLGGLDTRTRTHTHDANTAFVEFLQRLSRDTIGGLQDVCLCLRGTHSVTPEEAQAAISPQPLFAPKNEPLQDNEHFKDRYSHNTNESPVKTLCSRQGRRERGSERGRESAGSVKATLSVSGSGRNSSCCL